MNDIQFSALAHFAGRPGATAPRGDRETVVAVAGMIDRGLLRGGVIRDRAGRAVGATPAETTFDGLCALDAEEARRHDRLLRVRIARLCRDALFFAVGAVFAAVAGAIAMRRLGPGAVCDAPCQCHADQDGARVDHRGEGQAGGGAGFGVAPALEDEDDRQGDRGGDEGAADGEEDPVPGSGAFEQPDRE